MSVRPVRAVGYAIACTALSLAFLSGAPPAAHAAQPCGTTGVLSGDGTQECLYTSTGSDVFTVPAGVTQVQIEVVGGLGGRFIPPPEKPTLAQPPPGNGAQIVGTVPVVPGNVLQINVAGKGGNSTATSPTGGQGGGPSGGVGGVAGFGGSNGGVAGGPGDASGGTGGSAPANGGNAGGGGGASDVRQSAGGCAALTCALDARILVAAGGGGAGGNGGSGNAAGGAGGAGGEVGANALAGGGGGGQPTGYGRGATQSAGGEQGTTAFTNDQGGADNGEPGASGLGGAGGDGNGKYSAINGGRIGGGAGAGGGGGYFGGGGGAGGGSNFGGGGGAGGGGGGGSSYAAGAVTGVTYTDGANDGSINSGNGRIRITWVKPTNLPQAITFQTPTTPLIGGAEVQLNATADSGLPVTFTSATPTKCTVSGSKLKAIEAGTCTVVASQPGDDTYAAAAEVRRNVTIAEQVLPTVTAASAGTKPVGQATNVWGTARGAAGAPVAVEVLVTGAWQQTATGTIAADGSYVLPLTYRPNEPDTYRYRVKVTVGPGTAYSPEFTLTRTAVPVTVTAATAGTRAVGQATNVWGTATNAAGARVAVQVLVNGAWSTSQIGTVAANGSYVLPLTYGASTVGTYRYRVVVSAAAGTGISPVVTLTRTPAPVTVTAATAGTKPIGQATNVWGSATNAAGARVAVQVLVNGAWSTSQIGTVAANGSYVLPLTYGANTRGTYTFRVVVTAPAGTGISPAFTLRRT